MKTKLALLCLFLVAFGARLVATAKFEGLREGPRRSGFSDGVDYNIIATNLVAYGEFAYTPGQPTAFRAPGFPFLIAGVYRVTGINNYLAVRLVFCLIGALIALVVVGLAREVTSEPVAWLAGALAAVYPNLLYYVIHFSSEPLFTLFLTLATWLFIRATKSGNVRPVIGAGILLGLAALTRPMAFYFLPLYAVVLLWRRRSLILPAVLCVATVLPIAPWTIRNFNALDRWCPFTSNGGSTFWGANNAIVLTNPAFHGQWISTGELGAQKDPVKLLPNEVDRDRLEMKLGQQFLQEHVADWPRLAWYKFRELWTPFCKTPNKKFNSIILLSYAPLLPFMVFGAWLLRKETGLWIPILGTILGALAFYGSARFRSTIEPILLIFVAKALIHLVGRLKSNAR